MLSVFVGALTVQIFPVHHCIPVPKTIILWRQKLTFWRTRIIRGWWIRTLKLSYDKLYKCLSIWNLCVISAEQHAITQIHNLLTNLFTQLVNWKIIGMKVATWLTVHIRLTTIYSCGRGKWRYTCQYTPSTHVAPLISFTLKAELDENLSLIYFARHFSFFLSRHKLTPVYGHSHYARICVFCFLLLENYLDVCILCSVFCRSV